MHLLLKKKNSLLYKSSDPEAGFWNIRFKENWFDQVVVVLIIYLFIYILYCFWLIGMPTLEAIGRKYS